jgi:hypothetical protein
MTCRIFGILGFRYRSWPAFSAVDRRALVIWIHLPYYPIQDQIRPIPCVCIAHSSRLSSRVVAFELSPSKNVDIKESRTEWFPISGGNQDADQAIAVAKAGYATIHFAKEIIPIPFQDCAA